MIDITEEPRGETYDRLLDLAARRCESFSVVWRDQLEFAPEARGLEQNLSPYLIREEESSEWPGTRLLSGKARVCYFRLVPQSAAILRSAGSLYAWRAPGRPEDLAFYTPEGNCFLGSIAHESDAFLDSTVISTAELQAEVPGLRFSAR